MGSREKTLVVVGPEGAGKATLTGCMLFKYGGIDMLTMQRFQAEGIRTYDQAAKNLKSLNITPEFDTPKHHVKILDAGTASADCAILVLPGNSAVAVGISTYVPGRVKELIIVINKMDETDWSEETFQKAVEGIELRVQGIELGIESVPIIPSSALNGDNVVDKSSKGSWYTGWKKGRQSGVTLLEALDISFQS